MKRILVLVSVGLLMVSACAPLPSSSLRSERRWRAVPSGALALIVVLKRRGVRTVEVSGYAPAGQRLAAYLATQDLRICRGPCPNGVRPDAIVYAQPPPSLGARRQRVTLWATDGLHSPRSYVLDPDHLLVL